MDELTREFLNESYEAVDEASCSSGAASVSSRAMSAPTSTTAASEPPPVAALSTSTSAKPIGCRDNGLEFFNPLSAANKDDDLDVDAPAAADPRMRTTQVVPVTSQELAADRLESMTGPSRASVAPEA